MTLDWTSPLFPKTLAGDLGVHGIRRQIDLARPRNRAVVNEDLLEELYIGQRRQRTGQLIWLQPHAPG